MAVQSEIRSIQYAGNGSTETPYPVPFMFYKASHLQVFLNDEELPLVLNTDYFVNGAGEEDGGSILTAVAYDPEDTIGIARVVPVTQLAQFRNLGRFPEEVFEQSLDLIVMALQQIAEGEGIGGLGSLLVRKVTWTGDYAMAGGVGDYDIQGADLIVYTNFAGGVAHSWVKFSGVNAA